MATYRQLTAQLEKLQQKIDKEREKAITDAIASIRAKIEEFDITPEELGFRSTAAPVKAKRPLPPKYLNPKTGETWSGRGRAPAWLGKNRARFLIKD
ncbi:H-NS histone family protein [Burkholderia stagnalis]|uniref:H-NS histone n=1 Tax=Burkholderia stagnalis TaxID=1503054 RepID=A0A108AEU0_9BURK|nr:H-NS histone family protein [Burkholderia stagnalis]KVN24913.1 H-NS histone [Burkholderia pyrrocinia]MXN76383.1 H-NS histone family protein [Burkholderia sp. 4701]MXN83106.1 H-NS histone family protein [Burkholderia sp. 4812]RQR61226.1 H-NS histone family protein [Burkholderia sp. Bp9126]RQR61937.1 H-NS histone family protein [Burkholderia sp. Bp9125]RQS12984.1 H-NS histone family protein [Burkholderia sp. Bp9002]WGS44740.1 H-NS histone family protein [Burkholderia sp. JSH-S8]